VSSAAYVASQQAKTAMAIALAKSNDAAMSTAELERERVRADTRSAEAQRARMQTGAARQQTAIAEQRAAGAEQRATGAEQRASGAEQQAAAAQATASDAQQQTAQLQQRLNELQAKQTERGMLVTLGDVLFEFNRAEVKPGAQASLNKLADFLKQYPTRQVLIEGHTDSVGSAAYNESLSLRRANSVQTALMGMGVAASRVKTVGYGKEFPIADNSTDTNRALNRRVEVYIGDNDMPVKSRR
jgi:outer membrane protein OmpA-like peptidoglycan-associated protein